MYRILTNDLSFLLHSDAHVNNINDIAFGNESNSFVTVDESGAVKMWDLSEYKCLFTGYPTRQSGASRVCYAKDDNTVLVGYRDGFLRCFDCVGAKAQVWDLANAHRGAITAIYADQNYILTGGQDGAIRVWNRRSRQLLIQFNGKSQDLNPWITKGRPLMFSFDTCRLEARDRRSVPRREPAADDPLVQC